MTKTQVSVFVSDRMEGQSRSSHKYLLLQVWCGLLTVAMVVMAAFLTSIKPKSTEVSTSATGREISDCLYSSSVGTVLHDCIGLHIPAWHSHVAHTCHMNEQLVLFGSECQRVSHWDDKVMERTMKMIEDDGLFSVFLRMQSRRWSRTSVRQVRWLRVDLSLCALQTKPFRVTLYSVL